MDNRGRGRYRPSGYNYNNQPRTPPPINVLLNNLGKNEPHQLPVLLMDPHRGICRILNDPSALTLSQMASVVHLLARACLDKTSTESLLRLLRTFTTSTNFVAKLSRLIIQDSIDMVDSLTPEGAETFLWNTFNLFLQIFYRLESLAYDHLYLFLTALETSFPRQFVTTNSPAGSERVCKLFRELISIRDEVASCRARRATNRPSQPPALEEPPDDFRSIPIYPTALELVSTKSEEVFLRANKVDGRYSSVDEYLDIQFRLMREDFLSPLRDGIAEYKEIRRKWSTNDIPRLNAVRMYPNTHICFPILSDLGIAHVIQFTTQHLKHINWDTSARLKFGSLVMLSSDEFDTIHFATVVSRTAAEIKDGQLTIQFFDIFPATNQTYLMLESICYFEAYRHVLEQLQRYRADNFPMSRYLVSCETTISPPNYMIDSDIVFDLSCLACEDLNSDDSRLQVAHGRTMTWPDPNDLQLDVSQFDALRTALTEEIAVIQGPPGTGKTYVGLKIVEILVKSVIPKVDNMGPILLVCYTNHALDQFLEGILDFMSKDIVRIGTRSKSTLLEPFLINRVRSNMSKQGNMPQEISSRLGEIRHEMESISEQLCAHRVNQVSVRNFLHTLNTLENVISPTHRAYLSSITGVSPKDILRMWLQDQVEIDEDELDYDNLEAADDEIENILMEVVEETLRELVINPQELLYDPRDTIDVEDPDMWQMSLRESLEEENEIGAGRRRFENMLRDKTRELYDVSVDVQVSRGKWKRAGTKGSSKRYMLKQLALDDFMSAEESLHVDNPWTLTIDQRWRLYRYWIQQFCQHEERRALELQESYNRLFTEKSEMRFLQDMHIMRSAKIIAMTTTAAARYGRVFNTLQPRIVIVEEAAEVMETHVVASLSDGCEHLILIGDHKQLKPNPAVYRLAKRFNLDISLFERLIRNKFNFHTLSLQHRMRPEIAHIMRFIYPDLKNDKCIHLYPNVRGVSHNLMFVNHNELEAASEEGHSFCNDFEARFTVALCKHFLLNDYKPEQITILTLYLGQLLHLKTLMPQHIFQGVRVCSVDNYQGEENNIIILSLVRSNDEERIGFVGIENRICVALSRAKHGLFVFGNFDLLATKSSLWLDIIQDLRSTSNLANGVSLQCQLHPNSNALFVGVPDDFLNAPEGGCDQPCSIRLPCGHQCTKRCHPIDPGHEDYLCRRPCQKFCSKDHPCRRLCHEECNQCEDLVNKTVPSCGHSQLIPCYKDPSRFACQLKCPKQLNCGHSCPARCGQICPTVCSVLVTKTIPLCQHEMQVPCSIDPWEFQCTRPCGGTLGCSHLCRGTCGKCFGGRLHVSCVEPCKRSLVCGHICNEGCPEMCPPCKQHCQVVCPHNRCNKSCGSKCTPCREPCYWQCRHMRCKRPCSELCNRTPCEKPCRERYFCPGCRRMQQCVGLCGEACPYECRRCNAMELQEIFFGDEDRRNARYVTLWTCGHTFEVSGLDKWMNQFDASIQPKSCPKCKTIITLESCWRYANIVKTVQININKAQEAHARRLGLHSEQAINSLPPSLVTLLKRFDAPTYIRPFSKTIDSLHISIKFLETLHKLVKAFEANLPLVKTSSTSEMCHLWYCLKNIFVWLNPELRRFNKHEVAQAQSEMARIRHLFEFLSGWNSKKSVDLLGAEWLAATRQITGTVQYPDILQQQMEDLLKDLKVRSNVPLAGLTSQERVEVVAAIGYSQGHWYVCSNGHAYVIGDCGNPNAAANCPECNVAIGGIEGTFGLLASGNRVFDEIYQ